MAPEIDALRPALRAAAASLGLSLADEQTDALLGHLDLLRRWNATYNLTSVRDPAQMLTQHVIDCLAVIAPLRRVVASQANHRAVRLLDVGSGGGLPGIVIAILEPGIEVTCVDTVGKKAAFIQQAAGELRLRNLRAQHARVESLKSEPFDVVTSRAFASLADFVQLTRQHLTPRGCWMAMKGKRPDDELKVLPSDIDVFHVEPLTVPTLNAERCLVWVRPKPSL